MCGCSDGLRILINSKRQTLSKSCTDDFYSIELDVFITRTAKEYKQKRETVLKLLLGKPQSVRT